MDFLKKWYTYQKERFPVLKYGIYIFAIVFGVYFLITWMQGEPYNIQWISLIPMFIVAFLQFLMVRIIDEFKDYEEDCKYRPYRPVPRGLIKLKELRNLFVICVLLQLGITIFIAPKAIPFLLILWIFFIIMSKGFFIKKALEKNILLEVTLDELLMPILVLYLSVFILKDFNISKYFIMFLIMTYIISWIVEIARKIRCREDEEEGVKTYTAVYGIKKAVMILFILELILFVLQTAILGIEKLGITILLFAICSIINFVFMFKQNRKFAKLTEISANVYIFIVYFSMALLII